jgi:acyl-CoA thioester hydrolase
MRSPSIARHGETMSERSSPTSRNAYNAFRTITTRWMENDIYGHMNNAVHYSLFDTAVMAG